jgi:hypothetical protein
MEQSGSLKRGRSERRPAAQLHYEGPNICSTEYRKSWHHAKPFEALKVIHPSVKSILAQFLETAIELT